jgi:hypothetical protein
MFANDCNVGLVNIFWLIQEEYDGRREQICSAAEIVARVPVHS